MTDDDRLIDPVAAAEALPRGSMIVVRARDADRRRQIAECLLPVAQWRSLLLLIASDPGLAEKIGAHGVHFQERRWKEAFYWRIRHPNWTITISAHSIGSCANARQVRADAAFLAPVFPTKSHADGSSIGLLRARNIARMSPLPTYALGGIDSKSARRLTDSRFVGLAAVGALKA